MALNDFKRQLDTLSESLHHFDPVERRQALEILQECIQDLGNKNTEGSDEELRNALPASSPDKGSECSQVEDSSEDLNISDTLNSSDEKIDDERSEYNTQSDDECESQSEDDQKSELKCPKCEGEYGNKTSFLEHLQSYSGKSKSCTNCHREFNNSVAFKFHKQLKMCLKSSKMYKCKLCNKVLVGGSQYNSHVTAHKRNQCKTCGDHFTRKKHLEAHCSSVHNISINKDLFSCHLCERKFAQRRSLVYHYKITHPENSNICSICLETFETNSELESHQATHKQQLFTCEKCNEQFTRRQQYLVHIEEHEKYKCITCKESFSAKKAAMKHARQGHEVSGLKPQLQCAQCGQMFWFRTQLRSHMLQHTGGETLYCEKCKILFKHERNYISHLETMEHLRGEGPKMLLACKQCNKTFTSKNNLRVHVSRMHNPSLKEHCCTHCQYKTTVFANLKRHIAMHTEKPQFICDKCGSQFQTKSALHEHHVLSHSDTKEFSCEKCGKTFSRSSDLNRHLNTHSDTSSHTCHCGNTYKTLSSLKRHQLLTHSEVEIKRERLKKLFPVENSNPPKKKAKKNKIKVEKSTDNTDNLQLLNTQMPTMVETNTIVSSMLGETNTDISSVNAVMSPAMANSNVVMLGERHPQDLVEVSYNMDFTDDDKSHVIYTQNLDMSNLQVVESMIQLDDLNKQGASLLINVRNLFGRPLTTQYIIPSQIEPSIINGLGEPLPDITHQVPITDQKHDVISGLQDYIIPNDLNFLNV